MSKTNKTLVIKKFILQANSLQDFSTCYNLWNPAPTTLLRTRHSRIGQTLQQQPTHCGSCWRFYPCIGLSIPASPIGGGSQSVRQKCGRNHRTGPLSRTLQMLGALYGKPTEWVRFCNRKNFCKYLLERRVKNR